MLIAPGRWPYLHPRSPHFILSASYAAAAFDSHVPNRYSVSPVGATVYSRGLRGGAQGRNGGSRYPIYKGIRGLLVANEMGVERVYRICELANHRGEMMTQARPIPVFIVQKRCIGTFGTVPSDCFGTERTVPGSKLRKYGRGT